MRATNFGYARLIQEPENMTKVSGTPLIAILIAHTSALCLTHSTYLHSSRTRYLSLSHGSVVPPPPASCAAINSGEFPDPNGPESLSSRVTQLGGQSL